VRLARDLRGVFGSLRAGGGLAEDAPVQTTRRRITIATDADGFPLD
jgi:hypothetical protein